MSIFMIPKLSIRMGYSVLNIFCLHPEFDSGPIGWQSGELGLRHDYSDVRKKDVHCHSRFKTLTQEFKKRSLCHGQPISSRWLIGLVVKFPKLLPLNV